MGKPGTHHTAAELRGYSLTGALRYFSGNRYTPAETMMRKLDASLRKARIAPFTFVYWRTYMVRQPLNWASLTISEKLYADFLDWFRGAPDRMRISASLQMESIQAQADSGLSLERLLMDPMEDLSSVGRVWGADTFLSDPSQDRVHRRYLDSAIEMLAALPEYAQLFKGLNKYE